MLTGKKLHMLHTLPTPFKEWDRGKSSKTLSEPQDVLSKMYEPSMKQWNHLLKTISFLCQYKYGVQNKTEEEKN